MPIEPVTDPQELSQVGAKAPEPTKIPGWAAPVVAPVYPFAYLAAAASGKVGASPMVPEPGPSIPRTAPVRVQKTLFGQGDPRSSFYEPYSPVHDTGNPLDDFAMNAWEGLGSTGADWVLKSQQVRDWIRNRSMLNSPEIEQQVLEKQQYDQPLRKTWGGTFGMAAPYMALGAAGTAAAPAGLGSTMAALTGAVQGFGDPTSNREFGGALGHTVYNTALGAATSLGAYELGQAIPKWVKQRSGAPMGGYTQETQRRLAAEAVGVDAPALDFAGANQAKQRLGGIYSQVRGPQDVSLGGSEAAYNSIIGNLENASSQQTVEGHKAVRDFLNILTSSDQTATAEKLGGIATRLRAEGSRILGQENGNWEVGNAYKALSNHLDDLIQDSISNPEVAKAYAAARPQYAILEDLRWNPSLLDPTTGDVNLPNYSKFLQRNVSDYSLGRMNDQPLVRAANYARQMGEPPKPPEFARHPIARTIYGASHSGPVRYGGGAIANTLNAIPYSPEAIKYGLSPLGYAGTEYRQK